jgi:anti-anti-sigma factor
MKTAGEETVPPLELSGHLTIDTVADLCVELQTWLENNETPVLDLSAVDECDAAGMQLLYSASAAAKKSNRKLRISAASPAVTGLLQILGLQREALFEEAKTC